MKKVKKNSTPKLIKLDYGVLAMLHNNDLSGYDITNRLKHFWFTSHSRVYPALTKLENLSYVTHIDVHQDGKPDKKVYRITESGKEILKVWLLDSESDRKAIKNEIWLKMLCMDLLSKETLVEIITRNMEEKRQSYEKLSKVINGINIDKTDFTSILIKEINESMQQIDIHISSWVLDVAKNNDNENGLKIDVSLGQYIKQHWK